VAEAAAVSPSCPKCGAPRRDEPACPRCGLSAARMADFAGTRDAAIPEPLLNAWGHVIATWDDAAGHDELLRLIAQHDAYAWGAAKYREVSRTRPDDAIAERQVERLRRAAEVTMLAGASRRVDKTPRPYRAVTAVLVMLVIAAVAGVLYAMVLRKPPVPTIPNAIPAAPLAPQPLPPSSK
jgi:hypothetical protein